MAAENPKTDLLDTLIGDVEVVASDRGERIFLTPYLALACGLLYMMASDGELEEQESSQLQSVLGGDKEVLSYALRYVQSVPVAQFFATATELLSVKDKWCILANVCDALLSDGQADPAELALFAQMTQAFGISDAQFEPYFKILALKNDKSVLGRYTGVKQERQPMTPHFALAIALLYMLTADGSIGTQEIGQLEAVIGDFEGLQDVALKYVRSVKLKQFLEEAAVLLGPAQKIYILTNVCDSMLSDGEVARLEDKLFLSMLTAFGFSEKTFARYLQVIEVKNLKPFDTSAFKNHVTHERVAGAEDAQGVVFKNELMDAPAPGVWVEGAGDATMRQFIARTMDDNIQSVSDSFESQTNVVKVGLNATDALNLQTIEEADAVDNRQRVEGTDATDHLQKVEPSAAHDNRQAIDGQVLDAHRESIPPEVRLQNIHQVAEAVSHRLDRFESEHFSFLQVGKKYKFTDAFVLLDDDDTGVNRQLVDASFVRMGLSLPGARQVSELEAMQDVQNVKDKQAHDVTIADSESHSLSAVETLSQSKSMPLTGLRLFRGTAMGASRWRRVTYVQLMVAIFFIAFAAPIDTRTMLRRVVAGPLIVLPVALPVSDGASDVLELEQAALRQLAP